MYNFIYYYVQLQTEKAGSHLRFWTSVVNNIRAPNATKDIAFGARHAAIFGLTRFDWFFIVPIFKTIRCEPNYTELTTGQIKPLQGVV